MYRVTEPNNGKIEIELSRSSNSDLSHLLSEEVNLKPPIPNVDLMAKVVAVLPTISI